jgi:hypothetical protein
MVRGIGHGESAEALKGLMGELESKRQISTDSFQFPLSTRLYGVFWVRCENLQRGPTGIAECGSVPNSNRIFVFRPIRYEPFTSLSLSTKHVFIVPLLWLLTAHSTSTLCQFFRSSILDIPPSLSSYFFFFPLRPIRMRMHRSSLLRMMSSTSLRPIFPFPLSLIHPSSSRPAGRHITIDQQRMKERLGIIVRAKEG